MKRLSILFTLVMFLGLTAFAQQPNPRALNPESLRAINLMNKKPLIAQNRDDTAVYFNVLGNGLSCDSFVTAYSLASNLSAGFLLGHNLNIDSADAEKYEGVTGDKIAGVLLWFAFATSTSSTQKIHVHAWGVNGSGAPGAILGSVDVTQQSIAADVAAGNLTLVYFPTPITMPSGGNFFVGYNMDYKKKQGVLTYDSTRAVALIQSIIFNDAYTALNDCSDDSLENTAWVQLSKTTGDGAWHPFFDVWTLGGAPIATRSQIYPIVTTATVNCTATISPNSATLCKGKNVVLTASVSPAGGTFTWAPATGLNVTTGATVTAKPTTTTTYTVTNSQGCSGTVTVTVNPTPTGTITQGACSAGHILLSANSNPNVGVKYKWYFNNAAIAGATNSTYSAGANGSYKVKVTITATNCVKTEKAVNVTITCKTSDINLAAFDASAYPNPFTKSVNVSIATGSTEAATVSVLDFSGRTLHIYNNVDVSTPFEINENLTPGVYFVKVAQGGNEKLLKVVKSE